AGRSCPTPTSSRAGRVSTHSTRPTWRRSTRQDLRGIQTTQRWDKSSNQEWSVPSELTQVVRIPVPSGGHDAQCFRATCDDRGGTVTACAENVRRRPPRLSIDRALSTPRRKSWWMNSQIIEEFNSTGLCKGGLHGLHALHGCSKHRSP